LSAGHDTTPRQLGVIRLTDDDTPDVGEPVVFNHRTGDRASLDIAVEILNSYEVVSIQHEFGIYGGRDGDEVLELMSRLERPSIVTLHTVLEKPTPSQRQIMDEVCTLGERIVVMSETASRRLVDRYGVDPSMISVIAHGA